MTEVRANLLSLPAGNLQQSPLIIDFDSSSAWTPGTNPGRDRIRLNGGAYNSSGGFPQHGDTNSSDPNYPYSNIVHRFDPIGNAPPITTVPVPMGLGSEFIRDLILNRQSFPATAGTYQYTFTFTVTHTYNGTPTTLTGTSIVILRTDGGGGGGGGGPLQPPNPFTQRWLIQKIKYNRQNSHYSRRQINRRTDNRPLGEMLFNRIDLRWIYRMK